MSWHGAAAAPKKATGASPKAHLGASKQGRLAWENYSLYEGGPGANRLIAHSVQDVTMLRKYIPKVRDFLHWAAARGARFESSHEIDVNLADRLSFECYHNEREFWYGNELFYGFKAVFPQEGASLPLSHRALKGWERFSVINEGVPIPQEAVIVLAQELQKAGQLEASLLVLTGMDCYFRGGEWEMILNKDIIVDDDRVGFLLGVGERGERTKTGRHQGVLLDAPALKEQWRQRKQKRAPDAPAFEITADALRKAWRQAKKDAQLEWVGPLHGLRHAGASRDIEEGTRTLEQVRRRGRWQLLSSVQRYTKTHVLAQQRSLLTQAQLQSARELLAKQEPRAVMP